MSPLRVGARCEPFGGVQRCRGLPGGRAAQPRRSRGGSARPGDPNRHHEPPWERARARGVARRASSKPKVIETRVVPLPDPDSSRAALWARLPGAGTARPLILLSHLDVVPADARDWTMDPFAGVVGGGYVIGRGALDAKGVTVTHALALVEAKRRGLALGRDLILLATPDEEAGGRGGAALIVDQRPDLLGGAGYLLTEGGGILPGEGETPDVWGVSFTEKTPCWVALSARGVPGHGAGGTSDAATHRLVPRSRASRRCASRRRSCPAVAQMFAALAPLAAPEDRAGYASLRGALALDPAFRDALPPGQRRARRWSATRRRSPRSRAASASTCCPPKPAPASTRACSPARAARSSRRSCGARSPTPASRSRSSSASRPTSRRTETPLMEAIRRVAAKSRPRRRGGAARDHRLHRRALVPRAAASSPTASCRAACAPRDARRPRRERAHLDREPRPRRRSDPRHPASWPEPLDRDTRLARTGG